MSRLLESLNDAIRIYGLSISGSDLIGNKVLGWDERKKALLFKEDSHKDAELIDLNNASRCYVIKSVSGNAVRSIKLQIVDKQNKPVYCVPFYHQFSDMKVKPGRVEEQAKNWEKLLNVQLAQ